MLANRRRGLGMQVIVFASRKGGAGKTTLATHVAVEAFHRKVGAVVLIDADPMGGMSDWWNERKIDGPDFAQIGQGGLTETLSALREAKVDLVVIDTPPAATEGVNEIIGHASLVVVPVTPSPNDLRAVGQTLDMVENKEKPPPLVFVINNANPTGKTITHQASSALSQYGKVAPVIIRTRQDYRTSMVDGRTAGELPAKSNSGSEVSELWNYLTVVLAKENVRGRSNAA
jgi:chromosome partitioning protein